jgi:hypothetical protein
MDKTELEARKTLRKRQRQAAERLLDNSSLRDALTDDQGKQLLDWGLAQTDAAAARTAKLPDAEADPALEDHVTAVSDVMRQVNRLVAVWPSADEETARDHLKKLLTGLRAVRQTALTKSQNQLLEELAQQDSRLQDSAALFADLMRLIQGSAADKPATTPTQSAEASPPKETAATSAPQETAAKPAKEEPQEEREEGMFAGLRRFVGRWESGSEESEEPNEDTNS